MSEPKTEKNVVVSETQIVSECESQIDTLDSSEGKDLVDESPKLYPDTEDELMTETYYIANAKDVDLGIQLNDSDDSGSEVLKKSDMRISPNSKVPEGNISEKESKILPV